RNRLSAPVTVNWLAVHSRGAPRLKVSPPAVGTRGLAVAVLVLLAACIALAGYLIHLKRVSDRQQHRAAQFAAPPAPPEMSTAQITLMVADDRANKLVARQLSLPATSDAG